MGWVGIFYVYTRFQATYVTWNLGATWEIPQVDWAEEGNRA